MSTAIFRSTSQAIHFAYMMEAYEVGVESMMAVTIRRFMMELGIWNTGAPSTVNFGGLNALEVRAQCAMIRTAVRSRLPLLERWAIEARYSVNLEAGGKDKRPRAGFSRSGRRVCFSPERYRAIRHLGNWLSPTFPTLNPMAVDLLVARAVDPRVCTTSCRQMSEQMGASKDTWARALKAVAERMRNLENQAINRLDPDFIADGLVAAY